MIISKKIQWVMGHALSAPYVGPCNRLHGHNWEAEFIVRGSINEAGMVIDFSEFKAMKKWIDDNLDHKFYVKENHRMLEPYMIEPGAWDETIVELGIVPIDVNPTSESMAVMLHQVCCEVMGIEPRDLSVKVNETCTSSAIYFVEDEE